MSKPAQPLGLQSHAPHPAPAAPAVAGGANLDRSDVAIGRSAVAAPTAAGGKAGKLEELRKRAAQLMTELPPVLQSKDIQGFCEKIVPTIMAIRDGDLVEHLRAGPASGKIGDVKDSGVTCDAALLDVRQFKTWADAAESVNAAFFKCVDIVPVGAHTPNGVPHAGSKRAWQSGLWDAAHGTWAGWEETDAEAETVRLATCGKCQRVVTQRRCPPLPIPYKAAPGLAGLQLGPNC